MRTQPIAHVVAEMGISRTTASKWVNRYRRHGELSPQPQIRRWSPESRPCAARTSGLRSSRPPYFVRLRCARRSSASPSAGELAWRDRIRIGFRLPVQVVCAAGRCGIWLRYVSRTSRFSLSANVIAQRGIRARS